MLRNHHKSNTRISFCYVESQVGQSIKAQWLLLHVKVYITLKTLNFVHAQCVCVFLMIHKINMDHFAIDHQPLVVSNGEEVLPVT